MRYKSSVTGMTHDDLYEYYRDMPDEEFKRHYEPRSSWFNPHGKEETKSEDLPVKGI